MHFGHYATLECVSADGVVERHLATHRVLGTQHVVEVLTAAAAYDDTTTTLWLGAMRARARIAHRNVLAVQDCARAKDGRWFAVLAAVGARTLADVVRVRGKMPPIRALELVAQLAIGLEAIHARGVTAGTLDAGRVAISVRDGNPLHPTLLDVRCGRLDPIDDTRALACIARDLVDGDTWSPVLAPVIAETQPIARPCLLALALADVTDPDPATGARAIDVLRARAGELLPSDEVAATQRARRSPFAPVSCELDDPTELDRDPMQPSPIDPDLRITQRARPPRRALPLPARTPTPARAPSKKYERGERIGCGGMAEVFRGIAHGAEGFARPIAIKRMLPMLSDLPELAALFVREARIASRLLHPNVVAVHDFDRDEEDRHFLVMELVEGVALDQLIGGGPLPPAIARFVACEALRGLAHAHAAGIVHRDASPHNVLLGWDGAVKVADFGIASVRAATPTRAEDGLRGKPGYLAPEQTRGEPVDARADVFVIGIALWEMLAGGRIALDRIVRPRERRPAIPAALDAVVMRMLAALPGDRPASAETALAALTAVELGGDRDPRTALAQLLAARFSRTSRRRKPLPPSAATRAHTSHTSAFRYRLLVAAIISCTLIGIAVGVLAGTR